MISFIKYMKTLAKKERKNKIILLDYFCIYGELFEKYYSKEGFIMKKTEVKMNDGTTGEIIQAELYFDEEYCVK